jgi:hypothetical protein
MDQADRPSSMLRRALFAAPLLAATPAAALQAATVTLPAAPPDKIWVCVRRVAWEGLVDAAKALAESGPAPPTFR